MTTLKAEHKRLSSIAADIANDDERLYALLPPEQVINCFREASVKTTLGESKHGGFTIEFDEALLVGRDQDWIAAMRQIGRDAVLRCLKAYPDALAGLILGDAKRGQNYFKRFKAPPLTPPPQTYIKPTRRPKPPDYYGDQQSFDL